MPKQKATKLKKNQFRSLYLVSKLSLFMSLFFYLLFNIFLSQKISPFYFQLINDDKKASVEFLEKIKKLPEFKNELEKYKIIYGKTVENEVFAKENQQKQMIKNLEQILEKNPKARDVLYGLYLLNNEGGDKTKADEYLRRAKEIDPTIK